MIAIVKEILGPFALMFMITFACIGVHVLIGLPYTALLAGSALMIACMAYMEGR